MATSAEPSFEPRFVLTRAGAEPEVGRAGMLYRDLIPGGLGGRYIASHITIPGAGPVGDWVHYHRIGFQMIYSRKGWVRVVYEDQGEPFVLEPGDLVLQPPEIRHQVLESSDAEVVEITCPAVHHTFADEEMELPTGKLDSERSFGGQRFLRHVAAQTQWVPFAGGEAQHTAMHDATGGLAEVRTIRPIGGERLEFAPDERELVFGYALDGTAQLDFGGGYELGSDDSFVIPPDQPWSISAASDDFRLLHVTTARLDGGA